MAEADSLLAHLGVQKRAVSENDFSFYDEKMYPVHKRTESGLEIIFYHIFKF